MSVRLVDMDARCKYHDKKKKKFGEHWLFIGIAGIVMYEKKSLSLSLSLSCTHAHTWKCKKLRMEISQT